MSYNNKTERKNKNKRRRNILWFNPPYSENIQTNIGKSFLNLLNKHFPPSHKFHKIFNKNTVKLSYSCMPNMGALISGHNKSILTKKEYNTDKPCNCKIKTQCPMNGQC